MDTSTVPHIMAIIPARYGSTRFPGKPLAMIQDKPMIQHVWEHVSNTPAIDRVLVATDDPRIAQVVEAFGGTVVMTRSDHPSGTDRVWEAFCAFAAEHPTEGASVTHVLNVQGDEPGMTPDILTQAIAHLQVVPEAQVVTLVTPLHIPVGVLWEQDPLGETSLGPFQGQIVQDKDSWHQWQNPNVVKALLSEEGRQQILAFSRHPIPYVRLRGPMSAEEIQTVFPSGTLPVYRHLGLYLYRKDILARFVTLPPSPLETIEQLEQLRAVAQGVVYHGAIVPQAPVGIDTPEDLDRFCGVLGIHPSIA